MVSAQRFKMYTSQTPTEPHHRADAGGRGTTTGAAERDPWNPTTASARGVTAFAKSEIESVRCATRSNSVMLESYVDAPPRWGLSRGGARETGRWLGATVRTWPYLHPAPVKDANGLSCCFAEAFSLFDAMAVVSSLTVLGVAFPVLTSTTRGIFVEGADGTREFRGGL